MKKYKEYWNEIGFNNEDKVCQPDLDSKGTWLHIASNTKKELTAEDLQNISTVIENLMSESHLPSIFEKLKQFRETVK